MLRAPCNSCAARGQYKKFNPFEVKGSLSLDTHVGSPCAPVYYREALKFDETVNALCRARCELLLTALLTLAVPCTDL